MKGNPCCGVAYVQKWLIKSLLSMEEWNETSKNAKNIINRNHPDTVREWYFIPSGISPWSLFRNSILFGSISGWHQQTQRSGEVKKVIRCTWKRLSAETLDTVKFAGNFAWFAAEKLTSGCYDPTLILYVHSLLTSFLLAFKKPMTFWLRTLSRFLYKPMVFLSVWKKCGHTLLVTQQINYCQVASQNVCLKIGGFVFI